MDKSLGNHEGKNRGGYMINPLVSIIIPTYNYAHLIIETLESVVAQKYKNWECIIIDDGSTDNTKTVVEAFTKQHSDRSFSYITKVNEGTSAAKNTGLSLAAGKYIQFLDADDLISPDKLSVQVYVLESDNADLIFSKSTFFKAEREKQIEVIKYPDGFLALETLKNYRLLHKLIRNNIVTIGSPLVKKSILIEAGSFDSALNNNEDWLLWFKVALITRIFVFDAKPESYVSVRVHEQSAMNSHLKMFNGEVVVRKEMEMALSNLGSSYEISQLIKQNSDLLALHQVRSLDAWTGMKYILSSFVDNPVAEFNLFTNALFKLGTRVFKSVVS